MPVSFQNTVLQKLDGSVRERLGLRRVSFAVGHEFEFPGHSIANLFFVETGMASITNTFLDGSQVEVGMCGYESIIGVSALMGSRRSLNRIYTQIAGDGFASPMGLARKEFALGGVFQSLCLRYVQTQLLQAMQSTGCNAKHSIEQRLSRWLLLCADRTHQLNFPVSQNFLADMLGSTRPTVSVAAGLLRSEGLIDYTRGVIHIRDLAALERRSCECYRVVRDHLENSTEFEPSA